MLSNEYYESTRAIGKLYRSIVLQELPTHRSYHQQYVEDLYQDEELDLSMKLAMSHPNDPIYVAIEDKVFQFISPTTTRVRIASAITLLNLFRKYSSDLKHICSSHTLSQSRSAILSEEEAVIGTIVAKCTQPRRRKECISNLREQTTQLVSDVREEFDGSETATHRDRLRFAWSAWKLAILEADRKVFGAKSFWWLCLGAIFDCIRNIEEEEKQM